MDSSKSFESQCSSSTLSGAMGRLCLLGSWGVTGGSNSMAHQNLEIVRPGPRLPPVGLRERSGETTWWGTEDSWKEASGLSYSF